MYISCHASWHSSRWTTLSDLNLPQITSLGVASFVSSHSLRNRVSRMRQADPSSRCLIGRGDCSIGSILFAPCHWASGSFRGRRWLNSERDDEAECSASPLVGKSCSLVTRLANRIRIAFSIDMILHPLWPSYPMIHFPVDCIFWWKRVH